MARFMDKLKGIRASEGSLLDHTAILFGGAQTASHVGSSFPTILAGGKSLGFKHGQHVKWPKDKRPMSDLYLTILQQLGCPVNSFKESAGLDCQFFVKDIADHIRRCAQDDRARLNMAADGTVHA